MADIQRNVEMLDCGYAERRVVLLRSASEHVELFATPCVAFGWCALAPAKVYYMATMTTTSALSRGRQQRV